jgi:short-subunit dehydrogenase involved in D-alanine esterification of teichoic acids
LLLDADSNKSITKTLPDIDCVFLNAGVQHMYDMTDPAKFDLGQFQNEISVNFNSFVAFTHAILPFLARKETPTSLIL